MRPWEPTLPAGGGESRLSGLPLQLVDLGILAVIFLAPLFMGGRGPFGKFVFVSIVCLTVIVWAVSQCRLTHGQWRRSGVEWLLLASIVLVAVQLIPLPQSILQRLSPSLNELLPLWSTTDAATLRLGEWSTISLTPEATRGALVILVGYIMFFLLVVQRIDSLDDVAKILRWVAFATIAMAVLGLLQFLVGNGKFLWVYEHPSRDTFHAVKGPFHNQNHFAHFLALGVGPLIWTWTAAPARSPHKLLLGVGMGIVFVAGLLTFSRGGVLAITVASLATIAIFVGKSLLDKRALVMAGLMGVVVSIALLIHGYEPLSGKFAALQESRSLQEASHGRAALWSALMDGIPQFAWLGSGIGSQRDVYPVFMEEYYDVEFTHGENGYLPLTLEGGLPALFLMLAGIGICFWWCVRLLARPTPDGVEQPANQPRRESSFGSRAEGREALTSYAACAGAVLPGLLASVVHSLGDFVWYVSACMSITIVLAACACRLHQLARADQVAEPRQSSAGPLSPRFRVGFSRPAWIGIAMILVIGGTAMIHDRHHSALAAPHWNAYRRIALPAYEDGVPQEAVERELLAAMSGHLKLALQNDPDDPRANIRFAAACLRQFELAQRHATNPMALQQIREAALASQFASKEAQNAWLSVAIGENIKLLELALEHCHRALRAGPLQGDGYVYLADLSFLEGPNTTAKRDYIDQAYRVRPYSGAVAFALGQEQALAGDLDGALKFWRGAFHQDPQVRGLIIEQFSASLPGDFFLEHFQPETGALRTLQANYLRNGRTADAHIIAQQLVDNLLAQAQTQEEDDAAKTWYELQGVYSFLQDLPAALQSAQRAVDLDSDNVTYRGKLGALLLQSEDYSAAVRELQWCLRRRPEDGTFLQQLKAASRGAVEHRAAEAPDSRDRF